MAVAKLSMILSGNGMVTPPGVLLDFGAVKQWPSFSPGGRNRTGRGWQGHHKKTFKPWPPDSSSLKRIKFRESGAPPSLYGRFIHVLGNGSGIGSPRTVSNQCSLTTATLNNALILSKIVGIASKAGLLMIFQMMPLRRSCGMII